MEETEIRAAVTVTIYDREGFVRGNDRDSGPGDADPAPLRDQQTARAREKAWLRALDGSFEDDRGIVHRVASEEVFDAVCRDPEIRQLVGEYLIREHGWKEVAVSHGNHDTSGLMDEGAEADADDNKLVLYTKADADCNMMVLFIIMPGALVYLGWDTAWALARFFGMA